MRILFSSSSGAGHVQPVLPLAVAMRERGHDVRWFTAADGTRWVRAAGIHIAEGGATGPERMAEYQRRWPEHATLRGQERAAKMFPFLFGAVTAHAAFPRLFEVAREWRPDLVVSEAADFAAPIVAAAIGVPQVTTGMGPSFRSTWWRWVGSVRPRLGRGWSGAAPIRRSVRPPVHRRVPAIDAAGRPRLHRTHRTAAAAVDDRRRLAPERCCPPSHRD